MSGEADEVWPERRLKVELSVATCPVDIDVAVWYDGSVRK